MRRNGFGSVSALAAAAAFVSLSAVQVAGQTYKAPRTPDGQPDMQATWDFRSATAMERPSEFSGKEFLSNEEAADFETKNAAARNQDRRDQDARGKVNGEVTTGDVARAYNDFWWDFGKQVVGTKRTSLVVDPADGKIPALTAAAKRRSDERAELRARIAVGPEDRGVGERCILGFNSGPPMAPSAYNNNFMMIQSRDTVVILNEMAHNARIVPLDGRPFTNIPQWVGESRGRWEGDTLVVTTKGFASETAFPNASPSMNLVERFTRADDGTLLYEFTVSDPTTWTKPWSAQIPMRKSAESMYEYACHEGNYGMFGILSSARATDRESAEAAKKGSN